MYSTDSTFNTKLKVSAVPRHANCKLATRSVCCWNGVCFQFFSSSFPVLPSYPHEMLLKWEESSSYCNICIYTHTCRRARKKRLHSVYCIRSLLKQRMVAGTVPSICGGYPWCEYSSNLWNEQFILCCSVYKTKESVTDQLGNFTLKSFTYFWCLVWVEKMLETPSKVWYFCLYG